MATDISTFKSALTYGGARPSLFEITVTPRSTDVSGNFNDIKTQCTVSAIPPLTVTPIERQYFGRTVKIPGDMVFGDLSTTIINTENFSVRKPLESWMNNINNTGSNYGYSDSSSGYGTVRITQYGKDGDELMMWTFVDCWPQTVSEISLSYDTASDIEQFDVTWSYNYYVQDPGRSSKVGSWSEQN